MRKPHKLERYLLLFLDFFTHYRRTESNTSIGASANLFLQQPRKPGTLTNILTYFTEKKEAFGNHDQSSAIAYTEEQVDNYLETAGVRTPELERAEAAS